MPNERYVKVSMKDRWEIIPYDNKGDPKFLLLEPSDYTGEYEAILTIRQVFTDEEIVNLVNRALYVMKYQKETHANRRRK